MGTVLMWDFVPDGGGARPRVGDELDGERPEKHGGGKKKFRAALKVRGRFPKTQGFSNQKGGFR